MRTVLRQRLYSLLKINVGIFFNILNMLMGGNLPPLSCVCVIVEQDGNYLVIEDRHGQVGFPGGFMRWRERPWQAAKRECYEETGLQIAIKKMIAYTSHMSHDAFEMSTLTLLYSAEVVGGELRSSIEGRPRWCDKEELVRLFRPHQRQALEHYLDYIEQQGEIR